MDTDDFAMFGTQSCTPEVVILREEDYVNKVSKVQKVVQQLHVNTRKSSSKVVVSSRLKDKGRTIQLDDDDFMSPLPFKRKSNIVLKDDDARSRGSSDDFVTDRKSVV